MRKISKLILPLMAATAFAVIYFIYFAPSKELGSFSKFGGGSEINQQINVSVVKENGFVRDADGKIVSFFVRDINNLEIKITLHEPAPEEIVNAEVVELMGHMHGNSFVAASVSIIK